MFSLSSGPSCFGSLSSSVCIVGKSGGFARMISRADNTSCAFGEWNRRCGMSVYDASPAVCAGHMHRMRHTAADIYSDIIGWVTISTSNNRAIMSMSAMSCENLLANRHATRIRWRDQNPFHSAQAYRIDQAYRMNGATDHVSTQLSAKYGGTPASVMNRPST